MRVGLVSLTDILAHPHQSLNPRDHLPERPAMPPKAIKITLDSFNLAAGEKHLCTQALKHAGTVSDAAKLLGISRNALVRRIKHHNIDHQDPN